MPADKDRVFWNALHDVLQDAMALLPPSCPPEVISFPYEGEEWKEQVQVDDAEDNTWIDTEEAIRYYCLNKKWPEGTSGEVSYFVEERIKWARVFTRWLTIPYSKTGQVFLCRPKDSGFELLEWLLIDVYSKKSPPQPSMPMFFYTPDSNAEKSGPKSSDGAGPK